MVGAVWLRGAIYADIHRDEFASFQSIQVVVMAAISAALGTVGLWQTQISIAPIMVVARWLLVAYVAYQVGSRGTGRRSTFTELSRTTGFAQTPLMLTFLTPVPVIGPITWFAAWVWSAVATVTAVRAAPDYQTPWPVIWVLVATGIPIVILSLVN